MPRTRGRSGWTAQAHRYLTHATARLVLVDALAGFGKTTLVAQWRSSPAERRPFAWVSLDRADDDPSRLWWYIIGALLRACPEFNGEAILNELRVPARTSPEWCCLCSPTN